MRSNASQAMTVVPAPSTILVVRPPASHAKLVDVNPSDIPDARRVPLKNEYVPDCSSGAIAPPGTTAVSRLVRFCRRS
jgi:hypothetical protein